MAEIPVPLDGHDNGWNHCGKEHDQDEDQNGVAGTPAVPVDVFFNHVAAFETACRVWAAGSMISVGMAYSLDATTMATRQTTTVVPSA